MLLFGYAKNKKSVCVSWPAQTKPILSNKVRNYTPTDLNPSGLIEFGHKCLALVYSKGM